MGEHKHNPTAIAAKNGELPPKQKKMSKREAERLLYTKCRDLLYQSFVDNSGKTYVEEYYEVR